MGHKKNKWNKGGIMKKISIGYEIFDITFVIKETIYDDQVIFQWKEYYKDTFKNEDNCLYNVILDDFDLEFETDDDNFFIGLQKMCDNIVKKIRD